MAGTSWSTVLLRLWQGNNYLIDISRNTIHYCYTCLVTMDTSHATKCIDVIVAYFRSLQAVSVKMD